MIAVMEFVCEDKCGMRRGQSTKDALIIVEGKLEKTDPSTVAGCHQSLSSPCESNALETQRAKKGDKSGEGLIRRSHSDLRHTQNDKVTERPPSLSITIFHP